MRSLKCEGQSERQQSYFTLQTSHFKLAPCLVPVLVPVLPRGACSRHTLGSNRGRRSGGDPGGPPARGGGPGGCAGIGFSITGRSAWRWPSRSRTPMRKDTVFDLASLTKPIATAAAVLILIDRGQAGPERPRRRVPAGVCLQRQGGRAHPAPPDPHLRPARVYGCQGDQGPLRRVPAPTRSSRRFAVSRLSPSRARNSGIAASAISRWRRSSGLSRGRASTSSPRPISSCRSG